MSATLRERLKANRRPKLSKKEDRKECNSVFRVLSRVKIEVTIKVMKPMLIGLNEYAN